MALLFASARPGRGASEQVRLTRMKAAIQILLLSALGLLCSACRTTPAASPDKVAFWVGEWRSTSFNALDAGLKDVCSCRLMLQNGFKLTPSARVSPTNGLPFYATLLYGKPDGTQVHDSDIVTVHRNSLWLGDFHGLRIEYQMSGHALLLKSTAFEGSFTKVSSAPFTEAK